MNINMKDKICLVTGATDGIGLQTAKALSAMGATVYIHGRNREKGKHALKVITAETGNDSVYFLQADYSSLDDVRAMAAELNQKIERLDVLVNNAGASSTGSLSYSKEGYELTFAVNHLASFLLTQLLLEKLIAAKQARVVNVSSVGHKFAPFDINDLMSKNTKPSNAYFRSKFANILFSNELSRRYHMQGICSNALHPGTVKSNFGSEDIKTKIFYTLATPFLKTVKQGAETLIYLASSSEVEGKTGGYYYKCKLVNPAPETQDETLASQLWEKSLSLVGLSSPS